MEAKNENMLGTAVQANGDPADDPLTGAFVPGQVAHAAIVGGTGASDPIIGSTLGGLPELFSIATGVTSSVASKMYEEALLRTLAFTSTTARGTVLDTIRFDPFSPTCVNPAAVLYASVHNQFTGSVFVSVETVANSTLMGRLGIAYIPSMYPEDMIITPENLFLFDHAIMDVCASGKGTFEMKPTTNTSFVVANGDGRYYGRLVIIAYTDIANSFGTTMNIPLNVYSRLSPDSHYSGLRLASLPAAGAVSNNGFTPRFPSTPNATLITENNENVNGLIMAAPSGSYRIPWAQYDWIFHGLTASMNLDLFHTFGASMKNSSFIPRDTELEQYQAHETTWDGTVINNNVSVNVNFDTTKMIVGTQDVIEYDATLITLPRPPVYIMHHTLGDVEQTTNMVYRHTLSAGGVCTNGKGGYGETYSLVFKDQNFPNVGDFGSDTLPNSGRLELKLRNRDTPVGMLCQKGRVNSGVSPLGYIAVRVIDASASIAAVKTALVGESMFYGSEFVTFYRLCMEYMSVNPSVKSLTYSVNYTNGDLVADLLVNKYGMWMNSSGVSSYSLFLGELSFTTAQIVRNTTEWAKLRTVTQSYWQTRENTSYGVRRDKDEIVPANRSTALPIALSGIAQSMGGSIGAGMLTGLGNGLESGLDRRFRMSLQNDKQLHAMNMLKSSYVLKNWLAKQEYDRTFAKNTQQTQSTQSRLVHTSEQAAEQSTANPAWESEKKRPLYNSIKPPIEFEQGETLAPTLPEPDVIDPSVNAERTWEQSNAIEGTRAFFEGDKEDDGNPFYGVPKPPPIKPPRKPPVKPAHRAEPATVVPYAGERSVFRAEPAVVVPHAAPRKTPVRPSRAKDKPRAPVRPKRAIDDLRNKSIRGPTNTIRGYKNYVPYVASDFELNTNV